MLDGFFYVQNMLNINEKLLDLQAEMGADAFCVLLQISRYSGIKMQARPGNYKLSTLTGFSRQKITKATNKLQEMGLIVKKQLFFTQELQDYYKKQAETKPNYKRLANKKVGSFFTNQYYITTKFIEKYIKAKPVAEFEDEGEDLPFDDVSFSDIVNYDNVKLNNKYVERGKQVESKEENIYIYNKKGDFKKNLDTNSSPTQNSNTSLQGSAKLTKYNQSISEKIQGIVENPLFGRSRLMYFKDLDQDDIKIKLELFLEAYPEAKLPTLVDYLTKANLGKLWANKSKSKSNTNYTNNNFKSRVQILNEKHNKNFADNGVWRDQSEWTNKTNRQTDTIVLDESNYPEQKEDEQKTKINPALYQTAEEREKQFIEDRYKKEIEIIRANRKKRQEARERLKVY